MTTFFTDLDNTLIYSHRHTLPGERVQVEALKGKPQSFMTKHSFCYFQTQDWLNVVPVTTRTHDQFARLEGMCQAFSWRTALICNGSILLRDGQEDPVWTEGSRRLAAEALPAFARIRALAGTLVAPEAVVSTPFLFYLRTEEETGAVLAALQAQADRTRLTLMRDDRKVYCFPSVLDKGMAVKRYRTAGGITRAIAAGDSAFDLPMLEEADICFCPEALSGQVKNANKTVCRTAIFSDLLCDRLDTLRNEEPTIDTQRQRQIQRGGAPLLPCDQDKHCGHGDSGDPGQALLPGPVSGGHHIR